MIQGKNTPPPKGEGFFSRGVNLPYTPQLQKSPFLSPSDPPLHTSKMNHTGEAPLPIN